MIATGMPAESMTVCNSPAVGGCSPSRYRSASNNDVAVLTPDSTVVTRRSRSGPGNPNSQMRGSITEAAFNHLGLGAAGALPHPGEGHVAGAGRRPRLLLRATVEVSRGIPVGAFWEYGGGR